MNDLGREPVSGIADFLHPLGYSATGKTARPTRRDNAVATAFATRATAAKPSDGIVTSTVFTAHYLASTTATRRFVTDAAFKACTLRVLRRTAKVGQRAMRVVVMSATTFPTAGSARQRVTTPQLCSGNTWPALVASLAVQRPARRLPSAHIATTSRSPDLPPTKSPRTPIQCPNPTLAVERPRPASSMTSAQAPRRG